MTYKYRHIQFFPTVFLLLFLTLPSFAQSSSDNLNLLSHLDEYSQQGYNDCWGYTAPDGREYALLGVRSGTSIIDITDAVNAVEVAFIGSPNSLWKDLKTYQNYAYVVTEADNIVQIIDLSDLPNSATLVASPAIFETDPHNIYIDEAEGILYGAEDFNSNEACRIFSLEDPEAPEFLSAVAPDCHDMFAQNGLLIVAEGVNGSLGFYDVSNPAAPVFMTRIDIPSAGYVHNVWATEDNAFIMSTEETTGKTAKVWDIQELTDITLADEFLAANQLAHNAQVKQGYSYLSHYGSGLRIIDMNDPYNIFEAAFYETADAWGAFPYFNSGKVVISDFDDGFYLISFDETMAPSIVNSEFELDFGTVPVGAEVELTFELMNGGLADLDVTTISPQLDVFSVDYSDISLAPGDGQVITATFAPLEAGEFPSEIRIQSNAPFRSSISILLNGIGESTTDIGDLPLPEGFSISKNYPNPFNPSTTIEYQLPEASPVALTVYNSAGQRVRTLVNGIVAAGSHHVSWNGRDDAGNSVSSGMYIYIFQSGKHRAVHKMILMK